MDTSPRTEQLAAWSLVALQMVLLAGLVWVPGERVWSVTGWPAVTAVVVIAIAAVFAGAAAVRLGSGLTASPLPSSAAQLRTTGAYAYVRHPIYTGLLLGGAAVVLLGGRLTRVWVWLGLLVLLWGKTRLEERKLAARFPGYRDYAARTPRLVPDPRRCLSRRHTGRT
ncbi:methyltransferase family protein [Actinoplanes solisilvae]|uniref:methyltransferase family protein n=1 Tax=Actinoplanes solisilvae TaxID=2486853 RepID=UPI000FDC05BD|nr:isoprenylcysteine carboxylmethyltransferase family protein [Actinoplanes solisilvae]